MFTPKLNHRRLLWHLLAAAALCAAAMQGAFATTIITGTVEAASKYLVSGSPVTTTTAAVLKMSFEDITPGTNLALCAGSASDFAAAKCTLRLSDSGGPGFVFLTIVDTPAPSGKVI